MSLGAQAEDTRSGCSTGDAGTCNDRTLDVRQSLSKVALARLVGGGLGRCRLVRTRKGCGLGSKGVEEGGCCSPRTQTLRPVQHQWCLLMALWWRCKNGRDGQVLGIHDEGADRLEDECKEECAEHRTALPKVCASQGVGAEAAGAGAADVASSAAGADDATAAVSVTAGFTECCTRLFCGRGPKKRGPNADVDTWAQDVACKANMLMWKNSANNENTQKIPCPDRHVRGDQRKMAGATISSTGALGKMINHRCRSAAC